MRARACWSHVPVDSRKLGLLAKHPSLLLVSPDQADSSFLPEKEDIRSLRAPQFVLHTPFELARVQALLQTARPICRIEHASTCMVEDTRPTIFSCMKRRASPRFFRPGATKTHHCCGFPARQVSSSHRLLGCIRRPLKGGMGAEEFSRGGIWAA